MTGKKGDSASTGLADECEDKATTANGAGTTAAPINTNGIITPGLQPGGQTVVGTQPALNAGTQPLALTPTYAGDISTYLGRACTSCHSGGFFKPSPNLSTYEEAVKAATRSLNSMKNGSMPTSQKASDAEIKTFQAWVTAGTPQ